MGGYTRVKTMYSSGISFHKQVRSGATQRSGASVWYDLKEGIPNDRLQTRAESLTPTNISSRIASLARAIVAQKRMMSYFIILIGFVIDLLHVNFYCMERFKKLKLDSLDRILVMKFACGFFLSLRGIDFRGFSDIYSYKVEVLLSGFVNVLYFTMAMTLVEGWSVTLQMTRSSPKEARFYKRMRRKQFWVSVCVFVVANIVISLLDIFEAFGTLPWWLSGSEKTTKSSYGGIVQIGINMIGLALYTLDAKMSSGALIRDLRIDAGVSESSKQIIIVLQRYMKLMFGGLTFVVLFYCLGLMGQIPIVLALEDQRFLVGQNYPPCSESEYIVRDVGGFSFLFLYVCFSVVMYGSRKRSAGKMMKKKKKKKKGTKISHNDKQLDLKSTSKGSGSSGDTTSSDNNSSDSRSGSVESSWTSSIASSVASTTSSVADD
ncbi:hypothetical protein ScalyP_jg8902 [Parmales sp. scaly parma]|nr:hypothetical protein ScalyP_jg8902 [Parmales sp. scaly parma]